MSTRKKPKPAKKAAKKAARKAARKPRGRPTKFSEALANEICDRLSTGEPLAKICRDERMPAVRTVSDWRAKHEEFSAEFARARDDGFDALAAECLEIARNTQLGIIETTKEWGTEVKKEDMLGHRKLQIETILKLLAKWDPRRYGEKIAVDANHTGTLTLANVLAAIDADPLDKS